MVFIDCHCHLDLCENVDETVLISRANGVNLIVSNGVNPESNRKVLGYAEKYPEVKASLGLYPIDALSMSDEEIEKEIEFIRMNKDNVVAIGEVGLDFKETQDRKRQVEIFSKIMKLARELDKPLIIHSRKAEKEVVELLEKEKMKKVIMHCFSGNFNLIKRINENKWYFTIPASVKNSEHFQKLIKEVPIEQLLGETDSPYLHPDKLRDNKPSNVIVSYKKIAELKGLDLKEVEKIVEENYRKLFG